MLIKQPIKRLLLIRLLITVTIQFGINQEAQACQPVQCDNYITRTHIREVSIDNYITGYNTVISNGINILNNKNYTGKIIEIGGNLIIYLIPDYIDDKEYIIDTNCSERGCWISTCQEFWESQEQNPNFSIEKYKISTIPYNNYYDEADNIPYSGHCAEGFNAAPTTKYHYNIQQKGNNYELILSNKEEIGNNDELALSNEEKSENNNELILPNEEEIGNDDELALSNEEKTGSQLKEMVHKYKYFGIFLSLMILLYAGIRIFIIIKNNNKPQNNY